MIFERSAGLLSSEYDILIFELLELDIVYESVDFLGDISIPI